MLLATSKRPNYAAEDDDRQAAADLHHSQRGHPIPALEGDKRPGDPAVLVASSDKARKELGWRPQFETLEAIVESAWKWHKSQPAVG